MLIITRFNKASSDKKYQKYELSTANPLFSADEIRIEVSGLYSCQWNYIGVTKKITYSTTRKEYVRNPKQFVKGPNSAKRAWTDNSTIIDKESNRIGKTLAWNHGTWQKLVRLTTTHAHS